MMADSEMNGVASPDVDSISTPSGNVDMISEDSNATFTLSDWILKWADSDGKEIAHAAVE